MPQSNPVLKTYLIEAERTTRYVYRTRAQSVDDARRMVENGQCSYDSKIQSTPKILDVREEG